jgi:hypothetical protein
MLKPPNPPTPSPPEEEKGSQNNKKSYTLSPPEVETGRILVSFHGITKPP